MSVINVIDKEKCTGCKLCGDICPNGAIIFKTDCQGFWYPDIIAEKCNGCGLCELKCPSLNSVKCSKREEPKIYAAWSKDSDIRYQSTSGGVFWEIANAFIKEGGVVVGSKWSEDWKTAVHSIAHNVDELVSLRGSKYIQSDTAGIYKEIKKELQKGASVLFCGTPCQNAAVQKFIGNDENKIFYMDFICRSINSPLAFQAYIQEKEKKYDSKAINVRLKDKEKGWESLATKIVFENGQKSLKDRNNDEWVKGFLKGDLYTRDSCFRCQYRLIPRNVSDITIGDFWGVENESAYDMFRGISVVMVNTETGAQLLQMAKRQLCLREKSIEDVLSGNPALLNNPRENDYKKIFFEMLRKEGFSKSVREILKEDLHQATNITIQEIYESDAEKYRNSGIIDKDLYFYLNFECLNVIHNGNGRIIPYINTVINMHPTAKIIIDGDNDIEIGANLLIGSKQETLIRLEADSVFNIKHGGYIFYGTTIELKGNARFKTGYFSINTGSIIIIAKKVTFGEDVMIGRNVIIYDSDFHQILDDLGNYINPPQEVVIGDHVWLTANINVNKGVHIGEGSIVANQTVITKDIPPYSLVAGCSVGKVIKENIEWSRKPVGRYDIEYKTRKIILYGYGVEGKKFYKKHKEHIAFIIDNYSLEENVIKYVDFIKSHENLISDEYLWVIASPNHYEELYNHIKQEYADALVISYSEL